MYTYFSNDSYIGNTDELDNDSSIRNGTINRSSLDYGQNAYSTTDMSALHSSTVPINTDNCDKYVSLESFLDSIVDTTNATSLDAATTQINIDDRNKCIPQEGSFDDFSLEHFLDTVDTTTSHSSIDDPNKEVSEIEVSFSNTSIEDLLNDIADIVDATEANNAVGTTDSDVFNSPIAPNKSNYDENYYSVEYFLDNTSDAASLSSPTMPINIDDYNKYMSLERFLDSITDATTSHPSTVPNNIGDPNKKISTVEVSFDNTPVENLFNDIAGIVDTTDTVGTDEFDPLIALNKRNYDENYYSVECLVDNISVEDLLNFKDNIHGAPDIYELDSLNTIITDSNKNNEIITSTEQPPIPTAVKRKYIECSENIEHSSNKRYCEHLTRNQIIASEELELSSNVKLLDEHLSNNEEEITIQNSVELLGRLKLKLSFYQEINIRSNKFATSIYENAIKKINIDEKNLLRDTILKIFRNLIASRNFDVSLIDLSCTHSNIRKYILNTLSPSIRSIIDFTDSTDVIITPGMSITDIHHKCLSNQIFFNKLQENCNEIAEAVKNQTIHKDFLHVIQTYVNFGSKESTGSKNKFPTNAKTLPMSKKYELCRALKILIIHTILNLPQKIKNAIEKFDQINIEKSIFSFVHGIHVEKSLIRKVMKICTTDKLITERKSLEIDNPLIKEKLEEVFMKSAILFEKRAISPSEPIARLMAKYLLLDINSITSDNQSKLIDVDENRTLHEKQSSICLDEKQQDIDTGEEITIKNFTDISPEKLEPKLDLYKTVDILSNKFDTSIYENAIEKIEIDEKNLLRDTILSVFRNLIDSKNFDKSLVDLDKSLVDLSCTYSNIRKYILNIASPRIRNIMNATNSTDLIITPGMSITDIHHKCISNKIFFDKLQEHCKEIAISINNETGYEKFLIMIQNDDNSGLSNIFPINVTILSISEKHRIYRSLKTLIIRTIINLHQKIRDAIERFEQINVAEGIFSLFHGIHVEKSLIRKALSIYSTDRLIAGEKSSEIYNSLIKEKLEEACMNSTILFEKKAISPSEYVAKLTIKYLLLDIDNITSDNLSKLVDTNKNKALSAKKLSTCIDTEDEQCGMRSRQRAIQEISEEHLSNIEKRIATKNLSDVLLEKTKLEPRLAFYKTVDICSDKFTTSIYESAIKKIDIDEENLLRDAILKVFRNLIESRNFDKSLIDLSCTHSNIRKYILNIVSPYIRSVIYSTDIVITPGMSITDIHDKCISNKIFFDKLQEHCKEIAKSINDKTSDEKFLTVIQNDVNFNSKDRIGSKNNFSTNVKTLSVVRKDMIYRASKTLIIRTILNLPQKIKDAIEKFEQIKVAEGTFSFFHSVRVEKSFIREVLNIYTNDELIAGKKSLGLIYNSPMKEKLEEACRKYTILFKKTAIAPSEDIIKSVTKYLLLDISGITSDNQHKLINMNKNRTLLAEQSSICSDEKQPYVNIENEQYKVSSNEEIFEKKCLSSSTWEKDRLELVNYIIPEKLELLSKPYVCHNIYSTKLTTSIYEQAIKKIDFDEEKLLKESILTQFENRIAINGLDKSYADVSDTYSNITKYISDKICPCIDEIILNTDISMTKGMSLSDIKSKCILNKRFFNKLREVCIEVSKKVKEIQHEEFLSIIQNCINFDSGKSLRINLENISCEKRTTLSMLLKSTIVNAISDLPQNIVSEIEKFTLVDVFNGMFTKIHGVYLPKSFIRRLTKIYDSHNIDKIIMKIKYSETNHPLIKEKLEKLLISYIRRFAQSSVALINGEVFSTSKSIIKLLSYYLMTDITTRYFSTKSKVTVNDELKGNLTDDLAGDLLNSETLTNIATTIVDTKDPQPATSSEGKTIYLDDKSKKKLKKMA